MLSRPVVDVIRRPGELGSLAGVGGRAQNLIDEGEIEEIEPSREHAHPLMRKAEPHLASAPALLPADPPRRLPRSSTTRHASRWALCSPSRDSGQPGKTATDPPKR